MADEEEVACVGGDVGAAAVAHAGGGGVGDKQLPWVEKYRPKRVEEVSSQQEVVSTLQKAMSTANVCVVLGGDDERKLGEKKKDDEGYMLSLCLFCL